MGFYIDSLSGTAAAADAAFGATAFSARDKGLTTENSGLEGFDLFASVDISAPEPPPQRSRGQLSFDSGLCKVTTTRKKMTPQRQLADKEESLLI